MRCTWRCSLEMYITKLTKVILNKNEVQYDAYNPFHRPCLMHACPLPIMHAPCHTCPLPMHTPAMHTPCHTCPLPATHAPLSCMCPSLPHMSLSLSHIIPCHAQPPTMHALTVDRELAVKILPCFKLCLRVVIMQSRVNNETLCIFVDHFALLPPVKEVAGR